MIINRPLRKICCMAGSCSKARLRKGVLWGQLAGLCQLINWVLETRATYRKLSDCQKLCLAVCQLSLLDSTMSVPMCRPVPSWTVVDNAVPEVIPEWVSDPHLPLSSRFSKNLPIQDHDFISQTSSLCSVWVPRARQLRYCQPALPDTASIAWCIYYMPQDPGLLFWGLAFSWAPTPCSLLPAWTASSA